MRTVLALKKKQQQTLPKPKSALLTPLFQFLGKALGSPTHEVGIGLPTHEVGIGSPTHEVEIGSPTHEVGIGSPT